MQMKLVPVIWPRRRASRGLLVAVMVFAVLQAARPGYYFQHVATVVLEEVDPAGFEKSGVLVGGFGSARMSPLLAAEILQRATPEAIETLRGQSAIWGGISAGSADAVLIRECRMRVGDNGRYGRRTLAVTVGASDAQQAEYWGRAALNGILVFRAFRLMETEAEKTRALSAEIEMLGDQATEEMRQHLRNVNMGGGLGRIASMVIPISPYRPQISDTKHFVLGRFLRLAAFNGAIAALAGSIVFAALGLRPRSAA